MPRAVTPRSRRVPYCYPLQSHIEQEQGKNKQYRGNNKMTENRTASMLQRVPAILAVTASSYGLSWQAGGTRKPQAADGGRRRTAERNKGDGKPVAHR